MNDVDINSSVEDFLADDTSTAGSNKISFTVEDDEPEEVIVNVEEPEPKETDVEIIDEEESEKKPIKTPEVLDEPQKKEKVEANEEKQRKSRAKERIKQLAEDKKSLQQQLDQQRAETEAIRKEYSETTTMYMKAEMDRLTKELDNIQNRLTKASEEGDAVTVANLTSSLIDTRAKLSQLQSVKSPESGEQAPQKTQTKQSVNIPLAAEDWAIGKEFILENEDYKNLSLEQRKKISPIRQAMPSIIQQLMQEGFAPDDSLFYEELDIRLSNRFDYYEKLAKDGLDALEYNQSDENDSSGKTETPKVNQTSQEKSKKVPVSGPSHSSPNTNSKSQKIKLTQGDVSYWKKHLSKHITLEEYAKEMQKDQEQQKNKF